MSSDNTGVPAAPPWLQNGPQKADEPLAATDPRQATPSATADNGPRESSGYANLPPRPTANPDGTESADAGFRHWKSSRAQAAGSAPGNESAPRSAPSYAPPASQPTAQFPPSTEAGFGVPAAYNTSGATSAPASPPPWANSYSEAATQTGDHNTPSLNQVHAPVQPANQLLTPSDHSVEPYGTYYGDATIPPPPSALPDYQPRAVEPLSAEPPIIDAYATEQHGYSDQQAYYGAPSAPAYGPGAYAGQTHNSYGPPALAGAHGPGGPASLDEVALLRKVRRAPQSGWRRAVHKMSGGAINPGDSPDDIYYKQLVERVNRPVRGDYRIAVLSLKGGVGKTTTTVGLGSMFASLRGDRVIAVDANPDLGTLAQRIPQQTTSTVRDLLADGSIYRYSDVRAHTSQAPSRLEVLASERDPAVAEAFSEADYRGVMKVLQRFYNIIITDCGTGLSHSAMNGVLDLADALILVSSPAIDGARSAGATLDWLEAHGYGNLVSRAVVVLSSSRPGASTVDINQLGQHFLTRCRAVQMVPFDDHLSEGAEVDLDLLNRHTRRALVELAAVVADDFSATNMRRVADPFFQ